ncbi:D-aminoacyl-tRNA deacylase [Aphelenchoides fujianensis]|nr:D-aminoacyl-tRNA deacylase [Aphelenchoides fujianensis]
MRFVIQRVTRAAVSVDGQLVSSSELVYPLAFFRLINDLQISEIGRGICVLVGICREDTDEDVEWGVRKLLNLRLFDHPESGKRWNRSVVDCGLEILCVSQFTLHSVLKGNKLDFHRSMGPQEAPAFYAKFLEQLKAAYQPGKDQRRAVRRVHERGDQQRRAGDRQFGQPGKGVIGGRRRG